MPNPLVRLKPLVFVLASLALCLGSPPLFIILGAIEVSVDQTPTLASGVAATGIAIETKTAYLATWEATLAMPTSTPIFAPSHTPTASPTSTPTYSPTPTPSQTPSPVPTLTHTPTRTRVTPIRPTDTSAPSEQSNGTIPLTGYLRRAVTDGEEFYYDVRDGGPCKDFTGYTLEITLQGGDGRLAEPFFKNDKFDNVRPEAEQIVSGQPIRFNPLSATLKIRGFSSFTCITEVGIKIFGGVEGVQITEAYLIK